MRERKGKRGAHLWIPVSAAIVLALIGLGAGARLGESARPKAASEEPAATPFPDISTAPHATQSKRSAPPDYFVNPEPDNPLGHGTPTTVAAANALLQRCGYPSLPPTGPISAPNVSGVWVDDSGQVGFAFTTGLWLIFSPDGRTPKEFAKDVLESVQGGFWNGTLIPLRATTAAANGPSDPAGISWIEGDDLIELTAENGQSLAELMAIAESLVPAV